MSSSSNETEELVRSFPPPPPRNYWFRPQLPPPSYQPPESSSSSPSQPALSPPRVVSSGSEAGSIYVRSTSNYTYHQLDGHNSSAEQKARRKRARKEREPVIEVYFRHYCARCGRTRSKSYHRAHPVEPGKEPYPEICSICIPPEGPVSEVSSRKPREIEEVTEELLIRRGCGNRVSGLLKPRYVDVIRVKRRSESPDRTPVRRRKSDSSERIITVRTQSSYERLREPAKKSGAFDSRGFRVRVRSSSHNRSDREKDEKPAPQRSTVYDDDSCYDTRGRAIGHVRLVTVIHPRPREPGEPREPAEPQQPKRPKRSPSPPEWYFRRVRRVSASMPRKEEGKPEIFVDRTGYFDPEPSRRPQRNLEGPDWGPTARGALCQQEDDSPPDKHNPVRGVLQHFRNEKLNRPNDLYGAEAQRHRRRYVRGDSSGENEAVQERRVRFAPETRSNGKEAQRRKKYQEEVKDWQEEQRDKSEYKHAKKQVRKGVNEGGGKYELYDVDGHYSEEMGASDVLQDLQRDFEDLSVQKRRSTVSGVRYVPAFVSMADRIKLSARRLTRTRNKSTSLSPTSSSSESIASKPGDLSAQVLEDRAEQLKDSPLTKIQGWIESIPDTAKDATQQALLPAEYEQVHIIRRVRDSRDAGLD